MSECEGLPKCDLVLSGRDLSGFGEIYFLHLQIHSSQLNKVAILPYEMSVQICHTAGCHRTEENPHPHSRKRNQITAGYLLSVL